MKKLILFFVCLCMAYYVFAETITLKSGKIFDGQIIEKTDKYLKVDFQGVALTYYLDDIENINGQKPSDYNIAAPVKIEVIKVEQKPKEKTKLPPQPTKPPTTNKIKDTAQGSKWYDGVKDYLTKVDRIIGIGGQYMQQIQLQMAQGKMSLSAQSREGFEQTKNQIASNITQLNTLRPPAELQDYHNTVKNSLESNKAMFSAATEGQTQNVLRYMGDTVENMVNALRKLKEVLTQYKAPKAEIDKLDATIKLYERMVGKK